MRLTQRRTADSQAAAAGRAPRWDPLLEAVWAPGDVVVEEDVAALEVDTLAHCLDGDQDLDLPFPEPLLGMEARPCSSRKPDLMPPWM